MHIMWLYAVKNKNKKQKQILYYNWTPEQLRSAAISNQRAPQHDVDVEDQTGVPALR